MSFYTSLTGLNGAQADIAAISNNIANVGTTGFKRSRAEFGDIFATSPLQANSSAVGSGTIMKSIKQQFTQGNIESSLNALDLSISGQGFFALKPSLTSTQTVYTRNGAFSVNNDRYVVDAQGQLLQVFPVNADGSVIATGISSAKNLQLPTTSGLPKASQTIQLGLNLPADATIIPNNVSYNESNPYVFDKTNPATYNQSTSITIYDSLGNATIATIYYVKTSNATETSPTNKWQTHVFVGDREVTPQLITAKDDQSRTYYINKFGQITTAPQSVDPTFNAGAAHPLYKQDDQIDKTPSTAASIVGGIIKSTGFDFGDTDAEPVTIVTDPKDFFKTRESGDQSAIGSNPPYWGRDMFSVTVDGSAPQSVSIRAGTYTGTQLAAEMTRAVNEKFGGQHYFSITDTYRKDGGAVVPGNDIIKLNLSRLAEDGSSVSMTDPIEIDLLGATDASGTPPVGGATTAENKLQLTREQLVTVAQQKLNDALNKRHLEFGKPSTWPDSNNPPITVGYDVASRSFTFTVATNQLGPDANEPESRFNSIQVYNPTDSLNDLGIYPQTTSPDTLIRANTLWSGTAALPGGDFIVDPREQRTGIQVAYNKDTRQFTFSSGSTGEASSITVGRALLASTPDVVPQINSYDVSTMDFSLDHTVNLEINGRQLAYDYLANGNASATSTRFFAGIEQKCPVTISEFEEMSQGSSTSSEVQGFRVYGKIMKDDTFQLNLAPAAGQSPVALTVGPLTSITSTMTTSERLNVLTTAMQNAISAYNIANTPDIAATVTSSSNFFTITYTGFGLLSTMVSVKQTQRGSDSGLPVLPLTDATVQAGLPEVVNGTITTPAIQTISLKSSGGLTPTFTVGDIYRLTLPLADGSVMHKDVKLTAATLTDLKDKLNAAGFGAVTFSYIANGSKIVATYNNNGPVTGAIEIEQVKVGSTVNGSVPVVTPGTASTKAVQTTTLQTTAGASPTFAIGDTYRFILPLANGTFEEKDVTLTTSSLSDLTAKLNAAGFSGVTFTSDATNGYKIIATYTANGDVQGTIGIEKLEVGTRGYVRPEAIGSFTVGATGTNLEVTGDPAGNPFKLNMRIDGVVKTMSPIGSQGSTSRAGLAIGQAKSVSFLGNNDLLAIGVKYTAMQRFVSGTGLAAQAATAVGTRGVTPMSQTFMLNEALGENRMTFTIDGIVGTISLPIRAYTGDTFASAIQDRVNQIEDPKTGRIVSGVTVKFDADRNRLIFTSGTTGTNSQINVVGHPNFGLANVSQTVGSVPIITNLKQATDEQGNKLYVDSAGNITTQAPSSQQNWFPLYLQEGQLTFDTVGKLISPKEGVVYSPFDPQNGSDLLRLNIDYGKFSTQYSSPFSVLSLSQDGYPSGSLNGLDIDASGTIRANYTNGETAALGKIMVANFANANGLKQVGNATYVASSVSGQAVLGQAGADGFGTIKAGALERSNVDITQELVNLITAQRNFQANAKAIETTTTLSQTIIQIRG